MGQTNAGPNPVDIHVGRRVRLRRKERAFSQEHLATALGLTFQQIQKYERGSNRISASKLFEIAKVLDVPISYFFDGLADPTPGGLNYARAYQTIIEELLSEPNGAALAEAFLSIRRRGIRRSLAELVQAIAANDDAGAEEPAETPHGRSAAE